MKTWRYASMVPIAIFFFGIGWFSRTPQPPASIQVRDDSPEYFYTNPLLFTQNTELDFPELDPLKEVLEEERSASLTRGDAQRISIYFRELDSGKWTGVNPDDLYTPGSLLKVATMIAYLSIGEEKPGILKQTMPYIYEDNPGQFYKPKKLPSGDYSMLGLVQQMIIESDNTAMKILNGQYVLEVLSIYKELRMPDLIDSPDNFLSPRLYSRLFRVLYNATHLSRLYSESALKLLSLTSFKNGLVAGVPSDTIVAHKFGEHRLIEDGIEKYKQLHDCGAVYHPEGPYFICVMTQGSDYKKLETVISGISKVTYDYFDTLVK